MAGPVCVICSPVFRSLGGQEAAEMDPWLGCEKISLDLEAVKDGTRVAETP